MGNDLPRLALLLFGLIAAIQRPLGAQTSEGGAETAMERPMIMTGALGAYAMTREASGTSWQPDSSPHSGLHLMAEDWMVMLHGSIDAIYDDQGGKRGGDMAFSTSMAMLMAEHALGDSDRLGLRVMMSLEPLIGPSGYPLLFATGETANGKDPLIDRQHPHNLFMELSASFSHQLSAQSSAFIYAGLPGEPALGPPAFMHRLSGMDNHEAPITHHWLDSTHITNGVVTGGVVLSNWKLESSVFNGREPDQFRYAINSPKLDSGSVRLSWNPDRNWSLQTSAGYLASPEQLAPAVHERRITASASYNLPFADNLWATTFGWGRKENSPGHDLDGFLLESEVSFADRDTIFGRIERANEDELFQPPNKQAGRIASPSEFTLGYIRDFALEDHVTFGIGGLISKYLYPRRLESDYGADPTSFMLFMRMKLS